MAGRRADHASTFEQTGCSPGQFYLYPPSPRLSIGMTGSVPLDCVMFGGCLSALGSCTQNAVSGFVRFREGFRMPARRLTCAAEPRACVRKPPKKEPAGTGERLAEGQPRHCLRHWTKGRVMVMPSVMAVTRHRDIDDVRLDAALFFVPQTPVAQNARTEILDHDVRNRDQPLDDLETLRSAYVKADGCSA